MTPELYGNHSLPGGRAVWVIFRDSKGNKTAHNLNPGYGMETTGFQLCLPVPCGGLAVNQIPGFAEILESCEELRFAPSGVIASEAKQSHSLVAHKTEIVSSLRSSQQQHAA
jgi:hypothetical protein